MKTKIFLLSFFLILISCSEKENTSSKIIADLNVSIIDNPFPKATSPLEYENSILEEFKGIINKDSSFVMYLSTVSYKDLKNAIKSGELKQKTADSARTKIYVLSGFNKGKQYYIIDLNGNKDFADDEIVEFDKNISEQENYRDSFKIREIEITKFNQSKFYKQSTHLQFLPAPKYLTYLNETENDKLKHSLQLETVQYDYLLGTFKIGNENYGVGVYKRWTSYEFIFKKMDTSFFSPNHQMFAKYLLKDTLKLNNKYFKIDSLSPFPPKLTLNEIDVEGVRYGFRTNEVSKNYKITDLDGETTTLKDLAKEKDLILLDFWGTWCAPCKELTPELVKLHQKYGDKMQFISLAFELDSKPVLDYVTKNQMNWYNGIIKGKPKSGDMSSPIIGGLRIKCYPTFIVLDSDLNILFRTCGGGNNYSDFKAFLSSKLE